MRLYEILPPSFDSWASLQNLCWNKNLWYLKCQKTPIYCFVKIGLYEFTIKPNKIRFLRIVLPKYWQFSFFLFHYKKRWLSFRMWTLKNTWIYFVLFLWHDNDAIISVRVIQLHWQESLEGSKQKQMKLAMDMEIRSALRGYMEQTESMNSLTGSTYIRNALVVVCIIYCKLLWTFMRREQTISKKKFYSKILRVTLF